MAKSITYPFEPKSTAHLIPGQFWGFQISTGTWACGRVLALCSDAPTHESIAGAAIHCQRDGDIKTIRENGGVIHGYRDLSLDGLQPMLTLSQSGGAGCMLMRGYDIIRPATDDEIRSLPVHSTAGYNVIRLLAEKLVPPVA